jgi:uncharacterized repeat protein (TIGR03803 family)
MPRLRCAAALLALTTVSSLAQAAPKLTTLYSFKGGHDGAAPVGRLLAIGHALSGATAWGALIHQPKNYDPGNGSLFAIDLSSGAETVLYRFDYQFNGPRHDARGPAGGLVNVGGVLYGASVYGGRADYGTLFSFNLATGAEAVLHSFTTEGIGWASELTLYHASLYGVMPDDGKYSGGLAFKYDPTLRKYSPIYSFARIRKVYCLYRI